MTSIGKIGSISYYVELSSHDYWARENPISRWYGQGAQALGLSGLVTSEHLERLFAGMSPHGGQALVMNAGSPNRRVAWDVTLSAPKGFSTLVALAEPTDRSALERIHERAVADTVAHFEENAAWVRTGKGGEHFERAKVIIAAFDHATSRDLAPQWHSHLLLPNLGVTERNTTHALYSPALYDYKMAMGALYRASLAYHLEQEFGLEVERREDLIDIKGVPQELMQAFSSRRQAIVEKMEENGWKSAKAAALVALSTRPAKTHLAQDTLLARWQKVGDDFGFGRQEATCLLQSGLRREHSPEQEKQEILRAVKETLSALETFTDADIVRAFAVEAAGRGVDCKGIETLWREFARSEAVARLSQSQTARYVLTERPEPSHWMEYALGSLSPQTQEQEPEWEHL